MTQIHPEHSPQNNPNFEGAHGVIMQVETSKLLPWLMMTAVFSGIALGVSVMVVVFVIHNQSTLERASDLQYRQLQEYRIRTEDAENAVVQVNPNFHPKR